MALERLPPFLRWLLVLPTAVISGVAASIGVNLFYKFLTLIWAFGNSSVPVRYQTDPNDALNFHAYQAFSGLALSYVFVFCGVEMSPSAKRVVTVTLALSVMALCLFSLMVADSEDIWTRLSFSTGCVVGGVVSLRTISRASN